MRILLDTNIVIERENHKIINENLQELMRIINELNISILIHPKSKEDIEKDREETRKKITLSKIKTYQLLEDFPDFSQDHGFLENAGVPKNNNDLIDTFLLYAVFKNAVNFLITEDLGIHKKAKKIELSDRVLIVADALNLLKKNIPREIKLPLSLKETAIANLNLNDPIFDSLREDYPQFNDWFKKKAQEGRKCWIYQRNDGSIGAILIYKLENEAILSEPPYPKKNRFKIATMRVSHVGYKIGELLLKLSIELAIKNDISEIYLTHFTKEQDYLVDLIEEYGFNKVGILKYNWTEKNEILYLKKVLFEKEEISQYSPIEISKIFFPNFYDGEKVKKHIIPIQPQYHDTLFTDFPNRQPKINEYAGKIIIEGNTIKKAYLSHSTSKKMEPGDLLIFYRSEDNKALVSLGVIEKVFYNLKNSNDVISKVGKRTVYSFSEIEDFVKNPTTVILFNQHLHFKKSISYKYLLKKGILHGPPQSITEIDHDKYLIIKKRGGIDERFIIN